MSRPNDAGLTAVLINEISSMTPSQFADLTSILEYGWARIQAGESAEAVVEEWRRRKRDASRTPFSAD